MPSPSRHAPQQEWHTPMRGVVFQERFQNNKSYRKIENGTEIPFKTGRTKLVQQVLRRCPPPSNAVTLHYCAARESTIKKKLPFIAIAETRKHGVQPKCSIACHGGTNQDNTPDCPNISSMNMRTQRGHRVRDREQEEKEAKRQRRNTAGRWIASKGNDLVDIDTSGTSGSKGGSKGRDKK